MLLRAVRNALAQGQLWVGAGAAGGRCAPTAGDGEQPPAQGRAVVRPMPASAPTARPRCARSPRGRARWRWPRTVPRACAPARRTSTSAASSAATVTADACRAARSFGCRSPTWTFSSYGRPSLEGRAAGERRPAAQPLIPTINASARRNQLLRRDLPRRHLPARQGRPRQRQGRPRHRHPDAALAAEVAPAHDASSSMRRT